MLGRGIDHLVGVLDVAVTDDARQVVAGMGSMKGVEPVAMSRRSYSSSVPSSAITLRLTRSMVLTCLPVCRVMLFSAYQSRLVEDDVLDGLHFAGQHRREQDAVVVGVRFGAEDGDVVMIRLDLQQFFDGADTSHAVTDQDETGFAHV